MNADRIMLPVPTAPCQRCGCDSFYVRPTDTGIAVRCTVVRGATRLLARWSCESCGFLVCTDATVLASEDQR